MQWDIGATRTYAGFLERLVDLISLNKDCGGVTRNLEVLISEPRNFGMRVSHYSKFNQVALASFSGSVVKMIRARKITDNCSSFCRQCEPDRVLPPGRIQPHVRASD